jgi:CBS domain-containing protein
MMDAKAIGHVLARTEPFAILGAEEIEALSAVAEVRFWPAHHYVFRQGDPSLGCLMVVVEGLVEITVLGEGGKESVVGLRRPFDFFGETTVLSEQRYPAAARVRRPLTAICIPRRSLERLIHGHVELSGFFSAILAERMRLLFAELSAEQSRAPYACVAEPLFRRRVSDIMSTPVVSCAVDTPATVAARIMVDQDVGALAVLGPDGQACGMLSTRHLVRHLVADRRYAVDDCRAGQVCSRQLVTIAPEAYSGQALVAMLRHAVAHLLVIDRGLPVGMVTMADLVRNRSTGHLLLAQDIDHQHSIADLARTGQAVDQVLGTMLEEQASVADILEVMSTLHERLTRRVIQLAEEQMRREGHGPPPAVYCWINMGSAARREQTLRTDQDNAIVHADAPPDGAEAARRYFDRLGAIVVEGLVACGFARCPGGVMASERDWCRSLSEWQEAVAGWIGSPSPEHVRRLTILLDCRSVWGSQSLADSLWATIFQAFQDSLGAGHLLSSDDRQFPAPLSLLGAIVTEKNGPRKGRINLKTRALVHMVNALRLLAVNQRISTPSTLARLRLLAEAGAIEVQDAEHYRAAFETLMLLKIRGDARQAAQGHAPDHYLDPRELSPRDRLLLKDALAAVVRLQKEMQNRFQVFWVNFFR